MVKETKPQFQNDIEQAIDRITAQINRLEQKRELLARAALVQWAETETVTLDNNQ